MRSQRVAGGAEAMRGSPRWSAEAAQPVAGWYLGSDTGISGGAGVSGLVMRSAGSVISPGSAWARDDDGLGHQAADDDQLVGFVQAW